MLPFNTQHIEGTRPNFPECGRTLGEGLTLSGVLSMANRIYPVGKYHVILLHNIDGIEATALPVLWMRHSDHSAEAFEPLIDYFLALRSRSLGWMREVARALGLFYDFLSAMEIPASELPQHLDPHKFVLREFCFALSAGIGGQNALAVTTDLYWPAISTDRAKRYFSHITKFSHWAGENQGSVSDARLISDSVNRLRKTQFLYDFLHTSFIIKKLRFFNHLNSQRIAESGSLMSRFLSDNFKRDSCPQVDVEPALHTPQNLVLDLLQVGFVKNPAANSLHEREDLAGKMIFMLLAFAGLRVSEPFHLWFSDVVFEQSRYDGRVFLRHPSQAQTHIVGETLLRGEYLRIRGLWPRHQIKNSNSMHAGWKSIATDSSHTANIFFLHEHVRREFIQYYEYYLKFRTTLIKARCARGLSDHPFLFVSTGEDRSRGVSYVGDPLSINSFIKAYKRALNRVNAVHGCAINYSKENGTTVHGLRHFYGQTLENAGLPRRVIQKCMRHRSIASQAVYTQPTASRIEEELNCARRAIESANAPLNQPTPSYFDEKLERLFQQWR